MEEIENAIKTLIEKAAIANDSGDAMRFSQAACNAANARWAFEPPTPPLASPAP